MPGVHCRTGGCRHAAGRSVKRILMALLLASSLARAAPDLEVDKRVDVAVPAPGQPVEFTIDVRNVGADPALDVHVRDPLPPGLEIPAGMAAFPGSGTYDPISGDWAVGDLPGGVSATLSIPAVISEPDPPTCIVNTAETSHEADANSANDRAMAAVRQPGTERCVDVTAQFFNVSAGPVVCGSGTLAVDVRVINQGTDAAHNVVVRVAQSPVIAPNLRFINTTCAGASCTLAQLGPGETVRLLADSDSFVNSQPRQLRLTLDVTNDDVDFAPENDLVIRDSTLREFGDCPGIDVGDGGSVAAVRCFIATAAYGSALDPHVVTLRRFRDEHLRRSAAGRALIRFYVRHSPALAEIIAGHEGLRIAARALLAPLVLMIVYPGPSLGVVALVVAVPLGWRLKRRRAAAALR